MFGQSKSPETYEKHEKQDVPVDFVCPLPFAVWLQNNFDELVRYLNDSSLELIAKAGNQ